MTRFCIEGRVVNDTFGPKLHGKWASHTGYHSLETYARAAPLTEPAAIELAQASYDEHAAYPFVVGEEHQAHGWKSVDVNDKGHVQIRLPEWQSGPVVEVIEAMGMLYTDRLNNFWSFPKGVSLAVAKAALAPVLKRGTRFADERELADALRISGAKAGLIDRQEQLELTF